MEAGFLARLNWTKVRFVFQAAGPVELPPFSGPSFRGALGHAFRPALCERRPVCRNGCAAPESCRYYALFEQNRARGGAGPNIPKPMVLSPPVPAELESVVLGGAVRFPYQTGCPRKGETIPVLANEHPCRAPSGAEIGLGITFIGQVAVTLPPIINFLRRHGLHCGRGRLTLRRVVDAGGGQILFDSQFPEIPPRPARVQTFSSEAWGEADPVSRVRVVFQTPCVLKLGNGACFDPERLAEAFAEHCMIRAVRIYNAFFAPPGEQLPWMKMPELGIRLADYHLFHYVLPRLSFRQDRWMRFDGVVGYLDLEGELAPVMPFLRAAEVLHFGQKATFGLGEVKYYYLD